MFLLLVRRLGGGILMRVLFVSHLVAAVATIVVDMMKVSVASISSAATAPAPAAAARRRKLGTLDHQKVRRAAAKHHKLLALRPNHEPKADEQRQEPEPKETVVPVRLERERIFQSGWMMGGVMMDDRSNV